MKWFLILMLMGSSAWAQLASVQKNSKEFEAQSAENAKSVMLYEATQKAIEQFAPELGVNYAEFKTKLDKKFDAYFASYKEQKLVSSFGQNHAATLDAASKEKFLKNLEQSRQEEFKKFTRISDLVQSYSFKSLEQDNSNPKIWNSEIQLTLDKVKLDRFFKRILSNEKKQFSKILILTEIDTFGFTWEDLGLERDSSFSDALNSSWEKWFNENLPNNVESVEICGPDCLSTIRTWEQTSQEEVMGKLDQLYRDSVLARISLNLRRSSHHESLQESSFEWEGRVVLLDINTKRVLGSFTLSQEKRDLRGMDQKALNSALASSIYRSPLSAFTQFHKKLQEKMGLNRVSRLVIKGHRHMGDVLALMELLKNRGSLLGLDLKLDSFQQGEAQLLCFYQGEEKSFSDLLSRVKELKSSQSYVLVNEFTGIHHVLKLVTE